MIINFFLDNRSGGPHIYSKYLQKHLKKYKFKNITCGQSNESKIQISNLRAISKFLFPIEVLMNIAEIILMKEKLKQSDIFFSYTIYNIAPIISGAILNKKIYWFILENPTLAACCIFKILNFFFKINTVLISKEIAKKIKLKKFQIYIPKVDSNFWNRKTKIKKKTKRIILTCVGNINKIKNYSQLIDFIKLDRRYFILNIVGKSLLTQRKYNLEIIKKAKKINKLGKSKIILHGSKKKEHIKKILLNTDAFVLPSISEGLSIALMEAMSTRCFCIVSRSSNISNIIRDKKNGLIFDTNYLSFKKCLDKFAKYNKQKNTIGEQARATILEINSKFTINF